MEFKHLRDAVSTQIATLVKTGKLFKVAFPVGPNGEHLDQLYNLYLDSFPAGTNEVFRTRREYDCSCCKSFIRAVGGMVAIINGKLATIWDVKVPKEPGFQPVVDAMSAYIRTLSIDNAFTHFQAPVGQDKSFETVVDGGKKDVRQWNHFSATLPSQFVVANDKVGPILSLVRASHDVFKRGMEEITLEAIDTVLDLINDKAIYLWEQNKGPLVLYRQEKVAYMALADDTARDNFAWLRSAEVNAGIARLRNTAFGTLLQDISADKDLEASIKAYEAMVAPANYKRPTAIVTKAMIENAKVKMAELGLTSAMTRRFATLGDITVNNLLFVDRSAKPMLAGVNAFDDLIAESSSNIKSVDKVEEVSIDHFIHDILPRVTSIEALLDNNLTPNFVSLIAPEDATAGKLFKWDNAFSWSYNGDVTDSIKERVKAAGGRIEGDLCCRLAWEYRDDLDFHMAEPNGYNIGFSNRGRMSPAGGILDVDANGGSGMMDHPVENIVYSHAKNMKEGEYNLYVNNFSRRDFDKIGFEVELEFHGKKFVFVYDKAIANKANVHVATISYSKKDGFALVKSLPHTQTSKKVWGLPTQTLHKVNVLMNSPNYWDEKAVGNKHYFFMLRGAQNDGQARGFYNEFLREDLNAHRKVFEMVGAKMKFDGAADQLSGLGFSSTQKNSITLRLKGSYNRMLKVNFGV